MKKATIYGREFPPCQQCDSSKSFLDLEGIEYEFKEINDTVITHIEETQNKKVRSIPQIYMDNKYVGGYAELVRYVQDIKSIRNLEL